LLDEIGDQVPISYPALVTTLAQSRDQAFQLWLDKSSTDIYCRFKRLSERLLIQVYGLNGLTHPERVRVESALSDAFGENLSATEALVVDLYHRSEQVDWDAVAAARTWPERPLLDLLVVRQRDLVGDPDRRNESTFRVTRYQAKDSDG
jgi:hypothetical protein